MSVALQDMIEDVLLQLEGYTEDQDLVGTLDTSILATDNTFTLDGAIYPTGSGFKPGIIELGDELLYVQAVNSATGVLSGVLRGWRGTTATAWPAGTPALQSPRIPRIRVKKALQEAINNVYPRLVAVGTSQFTAQGGKIVYDLPASVIEVLDVQWQVPGPSGIWAHVTRWRFNRSAATDSTTGCQVEIYQSLPGKDILVTYSSAPVPLVNNTDLFSSTGLPDWTYDIVILGACAKLVTYMDAGDVQVKSASQHLVNGQVPWGSGLNLSKYFSALYTQRLTDASARFMRERDITAHFTR